MAANPDLKHRNEKEKIALLPGTLSNPYGGSIAGNPNLIGENLSAEDVRDEASVDGLLAPRELIGYKQSAVIIIKNAKGPFFMQTIRSALPFINSVLLAQSTSDPNVPAATALINSYYDLTNSIFNSPLEYVGTIIGNLNNESERAHIGSALHASWLFSLLCATPQIIILKTCEHSLSAFGQEDALIKLVNGFFSISVFVVPITSLQVVSDEMALSTKHNILPILSQILGMTAGILVAYPLSSGEWGAPDLSLNGVAYSLIVAKLVYSGCFSTFLLISHKIGDTNTFVKSFRSYNIFKINCEEIIPHFITLCKKALPLLFVYGSEIGVMITVNLIAGTLGTPALHAQLVVSQYHDLLSISALAIGISSQLTISTSMSRNKVNIIKYGNASIALAVVIPTVYTLLSLAIPRLIMSPFVDNEALDYDEVVNILDNKKLLVVGGVNLALTVTSMVSFQSLVGAGVSDWRMILNGLTPWLGVLAGFLLAKVADYGPLGLGLGLGAGLFITASTQGAYWLQKSKAISNLGITEQAHSGGDLSNLTSRLNPSLQLTLPDVHNALATSKSKDEENRQHNKDQQPKVNIRQLDVLPPPDVADVGSKTSASQTIPGSPLLYEFRRLSDNPSSQSKQESPQPNLRNKKKSICILM